MSTPSFIEEAVTKLLQSSDFQNMVIVLPGVRPASFIKKEFVRQGYTGILPQIVTIETWMQEIAGLIRIAGIPLWTRGYEAFMRNPDNQEGFESFLKWFPTLLKDFDDLHTALADVDQLFDYLQSMERLKEWAQEMNIGVSELMINQTGFWAKASVLHRDLNDDLLSAGFAYSGLLFRKAAENIEEYLASTQQHFVFLGFNALTEAEKKILDACEEAGRLTMHWDIDKFFLNNQLQEAGQFLRNYSKSSWGKSLTEQAHNHFSQSKDIEIIGCPNLASQAKVVGKLLEESDPDLLESTAVVLADEQLLPVMLHSLPASVAHINITMGLPLRWIPITGFFNQIIDLHLYRSLSKGFDEYYYKPLVSVLKNPDFQQVFAPEASQILNKIQDSNQVFISPEQLAAYGMKNAYFRIFDTCESAIELLNNLIKFIEYYLENNSVDALQTEYLYRFQEIFTQLRQESEDKFFLREISTLKRLYQQLLSTEELSFLGDPLVGLQLMGVLETRLLDFDQVILCSANEGTLPLGRTENSYVPYEVRRLFHMNTFLENDSIYAYHFYRLIQRCQRVRILYNQDIVNGKEVSRFVKQMQLEGMHDVESKTAISLLSSQNQSDINISKSETVQKRLNDWKNSISPSSLGAYLYDPLEFYKKHIIGYRDENEIEESAGALTLGNAAHKVLEYIYLPYLNKPLTVRNFEEIKQNFPKVLYKILQQELFKESRVHGKNHLVQEVIKAMTERVILNDEKFVKNNGELIFTALEAEISTHHNTIHGVQVGFGGHMDRVEKRDGTVCIFDYKTGNTKSEALNFVSKNNASLNSKAYGMQLLLYAKMYFDNHPYVQELRCGVIPLKKFSTEMLWLHIDKQSLLTRELVDLILPSIDRLIDEILDPEIAFIQNSKKHSK
ncbi:MAG: PD-(D/E)XK nuclease family protein [Weeksellaceae bacterium]|nr:PD-(D/E)XK nuclease family protein [Weeksellaceae bacterium]